MLRWFGGRYMIAFVKGIIVDIEEDNVIIDVNNIGYNVKISSGVLSRLPGIGKEIKLFTYTQVREDAFSLYGFLTKDDLTIFKKCITVNGIGPKGALALLSIMDANTLRFSIMSGDVKAISKAPGIGAKTAERLILDLRDKITVKSSTPGILTDTDFMLSANSDQVSEAVDALVALGYGQTEAMKAINQVKDVETSDAGALLKAALKKL